MPNNPEGEPSHEPSQEEMANAESRMTEQESKRSERRKTIEEVIAEHHFYPFAESSYSDFYKEGDPGLDSNSREERREYKRFMEEK